MQVTVNITITNVDETPEFGDVDTVINPQVNLTRVSHAEFDEDVSGTDRLLVSTYTATDGRYLWKISKILIPGRWPGTDADDFTLQRHLALPMMTLTP